MSHHGKSCEKELNKVHLKIKMIILFNNKYYFFIIIVIRLNYYHYLNLFFLIHFIILHDFMTSQGEGGVDDSGREDTGVGKEAAKTGMC